jgi:DNA processing protein
MSSINVSKDDLERLACLRLIRSENVGPRTFFSLLKVFKTAKIAVEKVSSLYSSGKLKRKIKLCSEQEAREEIERTLQYGAELIFYNDERYPELLKEIPDYPPVLTVFGKRKDLLSKDKIAIVGSRSASVNGANFAHKIAAEVSDAGYVITSGFARGIDNYAHKGSLNHGTIAVLANGIDHIYPAENKNLYNEISEHGLLITEQAFGSLPKATNFPQRNRIISWLSLAIIVIEASVKSGSLITARLAAEQNREVLAVPGFPLDIRYSGTNYLIKQGASLLETAEDVFNAVRMEVRIKRKENQLELDLSDQNDTEICEATNIDDKPQKKDLDKIHELVLSKLGTMPVSIDQLVQLLKLPVSCISLALIELELEGKLERVGSNQVMLVV